MQDNLTKVEELKQVLLKFQKDRDWGQFHDPKNLAEAIVVEAGELLELFLWTDIKDAKEKMEDAEFLEKVQDELSDVIAFCLNFANATNIDIASSLEKKIAKNAKKYPIEKASGTSKKYTAL